MNKRTYLIILAFAYQTSMQAATKTGIPTLDLQEEWNQRQEDRVAAAKSAMARSQPTTTPTPASPQPQTPATTVGQPHVCQCPPIITPKPISVTNSLSRNPEYRQAVEKLVRALQNGSSDITDLEITVIAEQKRVVEEQRSWLAKTRLACLMEQYPLTTELAKAAIYAAAGAYLYKINTSSK